jgi:hypothetical protein
MNRGTLQFRGYDIRNAYAQLQLKVVAGVLVDDSADYECEVMIIYERAFEVGYKQPSQPVPEMFRGVQMLEDAHGYGQNSVLSALRVLRR